MTTTTDTWRLIPSVFFKPVKKFICLEMNIINKDVVLTDKNISPWLLFLKIVNFKAISKSLCKVSLYRTVVTYI